MSTRAWTLIFILGAFAGMFSVAVTVKVRNLSDQVKFVEERAIECQLNDNALSKRISGNAIAIDYALSVAEVCAEKLGVSVVVREPKNKPTNRSAPHDYR